MPISVIPQETSQSDATPTITVTAQPQAGPPPNPYDILSTEPPTWGETARHAAAAIGSGVLSGVTSPADLPGSLYNLGAYEANNRFGANWPYVSTPGERLQERLDIPQPTTGLEHILSGAASLPTSALYGGAITNPRAMFADALRSLPTTTALGGVQGGLEAMGADPLATLAITGGLTHLARTRIPGLSTDASQRDLDLAANLQREGVRVNPTDLGPDKAGETYKFTAGLPLSGAAAYAVRQYRDWTNAVARYLGGSGAVTDENGLFTPDVIDAATRRINGLYGQANAAPDMPFNAATNANNLWSRLTTIAQDAATRGTPQSVPQQGVVSFINNLKAFANQNGGQMSAADIIRELRTDSPLQGLMQSDPSVASYYRRIRAAIDDEFGDHLVRNAPNAYDAYQTAKDSYRSLETVSAALQAGNGRLTPEALAAAVKASPFERSGGPLDNLAAGGMRFIATPSLRGPVGQQILEGGRSTLGRLREAGLAGLGLRELGEIAEQIPVLGKATTGVLAAAATPYAIAQNRAARAGGLSGPPPTTGQYYARALATPGYVTGPGQAVSPDPNQPLVPRLQFQPF